MIARLVMLVLNNNESNNYDKDHSFETPFSESNLRKDFDGFYTVGHSA